MTKASNRARVMILAAFILAIARVVCAQTATTIPGGSEGAQPFVPFGLPPAKTGYAIFSRFASLPSFNSETPSKGSWHALPEIAVSQVMTSGWVYETQDLVLCRYFDYETLSIDLAAEFGLSDRIALGGDVRAILLSGGILDGVIDSYHQLFGFTDMGRSVFPRNEVVIDLDTNNGISFRLNGPVMLVSDPQIHAAVRLAESRLFALTVRLAANIPAGLGAAIAGTPGFQVSAGLYADALFFSRLRLWGVFGGILPFVSFSSPGPKPMLCGRFSALLDTGFPVSPFMDLSLKGSPVETDIYDNNMDGTEFDFFAAPEMDFRLGFVWEIHGSRDHQYMAFAFQEDPFRHNSADVSFQLIYGFELEPRDD